MQAEAAVLNAGLSDAELADCRSMGMEPDHCRRLLEADRKKGPTPPAKPIEQLTARPSTQPKKEAEQTDQPQPARKLDKKVEEAARILLHRREVRRDFRAWCEHVIKPQGFQLAPHHLLIANELSMIATGKNDRLMLLLPPGSAKSTYASVLFPPWYLCQNPRDSIIAASHTLELAERFGRRVRDIINDDILTLNYGLRGDNQAAGRWATSEGAEYYAVGVGGSVTGRRADLAIIDDPVASREQAESRLVRDRTFEWYRSDLFTRLKPGGRVVLIQTRWHQDDLAGRLLEEMEAGGEQWRVVKLPAIADDEDPLGRQPGEALWPDWQPLNELERIRGVVGERDFASLYQQEPMPSAGALFLRGRIEVLEPVQPCVAAVRAWDLSASVNGDWTVGTKLGRTSDGRFVVLDVVRLRGTPDAVERAIVATAQQDGRFVTVGLPVDPGQAGKMQVQYLTRKLAGFRVDSSPESGSKEIRAIPVASQANAGNIGIVRAPWNVALLEELYGFPGAKYDDQVDALSRAFSMLMVPPTPSRRIQIPLMGR